MATTDTSTRNDTHTPDDASGGVFSLMAVGRLLLATASLLIPRPFARLVGVTASPELTYMTRVYGARAMAIGLGYLTGGHTERHRWQRLSLFIDTTDTLSGIGHLLRRDVPLRAALSFLTITGSYTMIGAARILRGSNR